MKKETKQDLNINKIKQKLILKLNSAKENYSYLIKPFFILLFIYILAIYPIIRANFNYIDDLERVNVGNRSWAGFSRFISEYLSIFIHSSNYLTDISPLTQIIAAVFLALSSVIVLHLFNKNKKITFINLISVIPIGLSPYFLECISYKYDSPYMALSILFGAFPFLFYDNKSKKNYAFPLMVVFGVIGMCMTYQASSSVIPLIALFYSFKLWNNKQAKESIKFLVMTAGSYLLGIMIFKMFIMVPSVTYVSNKILSIKNFIPGFFNNLKTYYQYLQSDFRILWLVLIFLMVLSFIILQFRKTKQKKLLTATISILLVIISLIITFGLYPALEKPLFAPRAMYGIGIFIALIGVNITNDKKMYVSKMLTICLCWCFFTFAFTYGNALSEQKRYIDFRVQSVINEINQLEMMTTSETKTITIKGSIGKAPSILNLPQDYSNIINRLIPQSFGGGWYWDEYYFANYFNLKNVVVNSNEIVKHKNLKTIKNTMYYEISTNNEDYILINLK